MIKAQLSFQIRRTVTSVTSGSFHVYGCSRLQQAAGEHTPQFWPMKLCSRFSNLPVSMCAWTDMLLIFLAGHMKCVCFFGLPVLPWQRLKHRKKLEQPVAPWWSPGNHQGSLKERTSSYKLRKSTGGRTVSWDDCLQEECV